MCHLFLPQINKGEIYVSMCLKIRLSFKINISTYENNHQERQNYRLKKSVS